jgi:hypothetical protein
MMINVDMDNDTVNQITVEGLKSFYHSNNEFEWEDSAKIRDALRVVLQCFMLPSEYDVFMDEVHGDDLHEERLAALEE